MAITIKTEEEIQLMRRSGQLLAEVLRETCKLARPGLSTWDLDQFAENLIRQNSCTPSFKGFHGYPASICTALNEEIVHSIPQKNRILQEGDLLTIDAGVCCEGWHTDAARSIGIGEISAEKTRLIATAKKALGAAIDMAKPGLHIGEISRTIQEIVELAGFHIIRDLTGHGIGRKLHEEPTILNFWDGKQGIMLKEGMTIAIEPIFSVGTSKMSTLSDGWTLVTKDNSTAVQEENTILITQNSHEILTE